MNYTTIPVTSANPNLRLLGRLDASRSPVALDWTGSGLELRFRGSNLWAELEAPVRSPVMWMAVLADGCPVARFPVEPGVRFYPLVLGMEPEQSRTVTLIKETQCMPDSPEATIFLHSLRMEGAMEPLPAYDMKIEFIGDSLTSGEGVLAPKDNPEWITQWFSAFANYSFIACRGLNAERRVLSQSGWGVCWAWDHNPAGSLPAFYDRIAGVLSGPAAEARGCQKENDFSAWQPDIVCIRLSTNDSGGMNTAGTFEKDRDTVVSGCLSFIRRVRELNPCAKIVWILPASDCHPELAAEAVSLAQQEGIRNLFTFTLPDYGPDECGARFHPNAAYNEKAGLLLASFLKSL